VNKYRLLLITLVGLAIGQTIAMLHVYHSNLQMAEQIQYLQAQRYLIVPNIYVLPSLKSIYTAFVGGLFFTGTIVSGIIALTMLISWFWIKITNKNKMALVIIIIQWFIAIYQTNVNGWSAFTLYLCILMPVLFGICLLFPGYDNHSTQYPAIFWCLPFILMIAMSYGTGKTVSFLSIRDFLLLSNTPGQTCNDLYYRYTLYPGEVIKPFALKQQKTCFIDSRHPNNKRYFKTIVRKCIAYDYLVVPDQHMADVSLIIDHQKICFQINDRLIMKTDIMHFLQETRSVLSDFSQKTDTNEFFRMCILLSLIMGAPILIYMITIHLLCLLIQLVNVPDRISYWLVMSVLCLFVVIIIYQFPSNISDSIDQKDWEKTFQQAYTEKNWRKGCVLLKSHDYQQQTNIETQIATNWLSQTDHPVLKYWLIRFLSNTPGHSNLFIQYLDDPHVNVVCQAVYALGCQRDRGLIPPIVSFLNDCPHWYVQMYAYRALKRLGWQNNRPVVK